jgi:hypothetical protein
MFVAADPAWELTRLVECPSCSHSRVSNPQLSRVDCASVALRVLLLANSLRSAVASDGIEHRCSLRNSCQDVVDDLTQLSTQLVESSG